MNVSEKKHRQPKEFYKGKIATMFTLCIQNKQNVFISSEIVNHFVEILENIVVGEKCIVPVYCFMPNHQHLIIAGLSDESNIWKTIVNYKQKTGFWFSKNMPQVKWQKDFFDHVIKKNETLANQVRYVLDNPVRKNLIGVWQNYVFSGSIGCELEDILKTIV